jgi:hypothetical protein
VYLQDLPAL